MNLNRNLRRFFLSVACLALVISVSMPSAASWGKSVPMVPASFSELAKQAKPAVVNIRTVKVTKGGGRVFKHFFGQPFGGGGGGGGENPFRDFFEPFMRQQPQRDYKQQSLGSGFIISRDGYIVTNNHVVAEADEIRVKLYNEKEYDAKIVGADPKTDLALIKVEADDLEHLELGDSESLEVGTWVVAIGSPFGLEQTVTAGIVSAKGRIIGSGPYDDFIQTDASINPGNSGGPLLNLEGEVVGINTAIVASGQGIGFAIPSKLAGGIIEQLRDSGEVIRGWMGVAIQDITPELAGYYNLEEKSGVLVAKVYKNDPADKAGIEPGDIVTHVKGERVKTSRDLSAAVAGLGVGKKIPVTLIREGKEKTVHVVLAKRSEAEAAVALSDTGFDPFGLGFQELDPSNANDFGYARNVRGLVVADIKPDGKAAGTGIRRGDLLKEVNHVRVATVEQYLDVLSEIKKGQQVQLLFRRGNTNFIVVRLTK
ncbi:MAG: Do family serine endopeptidase [Desulfobacteraceae bacterium]|nr:Do family serine endopeptidase [Desulfobacteraceae bacterium]